MLSIYGPLCYGPNTLATAPFRCVLLRNSMLLRRDRNRIQLPPRSPSITPQEAQHSPPHQEQPRIPRTTPKLKAPQGEKALRPCERVVFSVQDRVGFKLEGWRRSAPLRHHPLETLNPKP